MVFLLMRGFSILSFSSALEILKAANDVLGRDVYSWRIVGHQDRTVSSSTGLTITADTCLPRERKMFRQIDVPDMLFLCGGTQAEAINCNNINVLLRWAKNAGADIIGLDSGAFILATAGLLEQRTCTVHWELIPAFEEKFGIKTQVTNAIYSADNKIYTCAGRAATLDFVTHLVAKHHGGQIARADPAIDESIVR